jgi:hypothetical protein
MLNIQRVRGMKLNVFLRISGIILTVSDRKRPGVSGPIRSFIMYSYAQCTMQKDQCIVEMYPGWPIWSRDLVPSTLSTYPPPYLPGVMGTQFTSSLQEEWTRTVEWRYLDPVIPDNVC